MSKLGSQYGLLGGFVKWATDQINSLVGRMTTAEGKLVVTKVYTSPQQTITAAGGLTLAHGLGVVPKFVTAQLVCTVAENGYAIGDTLQCVVTEIATSALDGKGHVIKVDATNITVRFGSAGGGSNFDAVNATSGAAVGLLNTNWKVVYTAYA